jgi:predicted enzyme related to lactoylglutathione lyase
VSAAFLKAVFGWQKSDMDMGDAGTYSFLRNGTGTVGALCGQAPGQAVPSAWNVYFGVADADAATDRARRLGAEILAAPFDVETHGRMSVLRDPAGAVFSLWQSRNPGSGDFTMFEDHAVGWVELATRDLSIARRFYAELLGWEFFLSKADVPGGENREYGVGGTRYGGILPMTKEWGDMPSHWSIYVMVPDLEACLARVAEAGGKVCVPAFDVPGVGRIARIDDPTGAGVYVIRLGAA